MAFNIDMSPLERSSMNIGRTLVDIGNSFAQQRQQAQKQQQQGDIDAFTQQAISGDPRALEELMSRDPQRAQMVQGFMQQKREGEQAQDAQFTSQIAQETAGFVEQMHLAPQEAQEAMFNAAVDDPRYDIDEEDRQYFMDDNARKALIGKVKGKEYAENFFGQKDKATAFQQGTGEMSGYSFNPTDGTYAINATLKAKLDEVKASGKLELKDKITLNKEFTNLTKETKLIRNTAKDLEKLSKMVGPDGNVSGPASIAMVYKFMKALDPASVVKQDEFATAENSSGVPLQIRNMYNKLMQGGKLGTKQVSEFLATAQGLANSAIDSSTVEITDYLNTFEDDLSSNFRNALLKRIPKRFDIAPKAVEEVEVAVASTARKDAQALEWANANPNDPRAEAILKKLQGVK